jgi:hypothetical protein
MMKVESSKWVEELGYRTPNKSGGLEEHLAPEKNTNEPHNVKFIRQDGRYKINHRMDDTGI